MAKRFHCIECGDCIGAETMAEARARHDAQEVPEGEYNGLDEDMLYESAEGANDCAECVGLTAEDGNARPIK